MALNIRVGITCLQKPFIENRSISHNVFNFYWSKGLKNKVQVFTIIKKELVNKIIVDNRTNLVDHSYFLTLDLQDIDNRINKLAIQTKVVNLYDNLVRQKHI